MEKEKHLDTSAGIINAFKKAGIECTRITIKINPQREKDVSDYVRKIEDAHRNAANSRLIFGTSLAPTLQP